MALSPRRHVLCCLLSVVSFARSASDLYRELGLRRGASSADIKAAYRDAAKRYHPDKNKDPKAQERFRRIASAYETLSDSEKRRLYDLHGEHYSRVEQERQRYDQHRRQQEEFFNAFRGRRRTKGPSIFSSTLRVSSEGYRDLVEDSTDAWLLQLYHGAREASQVWQERPGVSNNRASLSPLVFRLPRRAQIGASRARNLRRAGRRSRPSCRRWST